MKQRLWTTRTPLRQLCLLWAVLMLVSVALAGQPASAQGQGASYVQDQYYLGAGGTPPTLAAFAANPQGYLRYPAAYQSLKQGFEQATGTRLSDQGFSQLLTSDRVRLVGCSGRITTSRITAGGAVSYFTRGCYRGERLIQVRTSAGWVPVASQGCFNLARLAPPPPSEKVCRLVPVDEGVVYDRANTWRSPGQSIDLCNCADDYDLPDASGISRSTISSTRFVEVCE